MNSGPQRLLSAVQVNLPHGCNIQINQTRSRSTTTGWLVWPVAEQLCKYLIDSPALVEGKAVLELGAGTGLVGLVCCFMGARKVILTDLPEALPLCSQNLDLNRCVMSDECVVYTRKLSWGDDEDVSKVLTEAGSIDLIIGSDIVYHQSEEALTSLVKTISAASNPSTVVIIAYEDREGMIEDEHFFLCPMRNLFASLESVDLGDSRVLFIFSHFKKQ
jgi:predicted nicotinamide N-methyase